MYTDRFANREKLGPIIEIDLHPYIAIVYGERQLDGTLVPTLSVLYTYAGSVMGSFDGDVTGAEARLALDAYLKDASWHPVKETVVVRPGIIIEMEWYVYDDGVREVPGTRVTVLYCEGRRDLVVQGRLTDKEIGEMLEYAMRLILIHKPPTQTPGSNMTP